VPICVRAKWLLIPFFWRLLAHGLNVLLPSKV